jgi:hypothetical protein
MLGVRHDRARNKTGTYCFVNSCFGSLVREEWKSKLAPAIVLDEGIFTGEMGRCFRPERIVSCTKTTEEGMLDVCLHDEDTFTPHFYWPWDLLREVPVR